MYDTIEYLLGIIEREGAHTRKARSASDMLRETFNHAQRQNRIQLREKYRLKGIPGACQACFGSHWDENGELCECFNPTPDKSPIDHH